MQITAFVLVATFLALVAWIGWSIAATPTAPRGNEEPSTQEPAKNSPKVLVTFLKKIGGKGALSALSHEYGYFENYVEEVGV